MAKKPKTTGAEFRKRSKAAKLGHKRRKANKVLPAELRKERKLADNARIVIGKKPKKRTPNPRITAKKETLSQKVKRLEAEIALERSRREADLATAHFTPTRPQEFLHKDGTLAVMPSRLRHLEESKRLRKALKKALAKSRMDFDELAYSIADYYEVEVREVYTLHMSP